MNLSDDDDDRVAWSRRYDMVRVRVRRKHDFELLRARARLMFLKVCRLIVMVSITRETRMVETVPRYTLWKETVCTFLVT